MQLLARTIGLWVAVILGLVVPTQAAGRDDVPNIVLLFADDAGYGDFGFQGSRVMRTPQLDQLAREGVRFTQAYVTDPTCGPSRAGLLTGRYQQRFGFEENNVPGYMSPSSKLDGEDMGLPLGERTIADYLRGLGYRTALLGKWHQGDADRYHPLRRGFDDFYGFRGGSRSYWAYSDPAHPPLPQNRLERGFRNFQEHDGYLTDALAAEAAAFIRRNRDRPFFLFVSFNAVHAPMEAHPDDLAAFPHLTGRRKEAAALMRSLDRASGTILAALAANGLSANTLVVFTNDNGGEVPANGSVNYPLAGTKATFLEGGIRVPMLMRWPGKLRAGRTYRAPVSLLDLLPTFAEAAGGAAAELQNIDGISLLPYLLGDNEQQARTLYWKRGARAAVRDGDWKLVRHADRPAELFNLAHDIGEQKDLATRHAAVTRRLYRKLFRWETSLERPLWMLRGEYDRSDVEWMDRYRVPSSTWGPLNPNQPDN